MAKTKAAPPKQITVLHVQVDVHEGDKLGAARVTMTDADDYTRIGTREFPGVTEALDNVCLMLLKVKVAQTMAKMSEEMLANGKVGHA